MSGVKLRRKLLLVLSIVCLLFCELESAEGASVVDSTATLPPQVSAGISTIKPISEAVSQVSPTQPQGVDFGVCTKSFKIDSQKLFYLTLASVNANRFSINEMKSLTGYVIFSAAHGEFLAMVIQVDDKNSMLKIIPCNNTYYFPVGIVQNMFKYVELNLNTPIEKLSVL